MTRKPVDGSASVCLDGATLKRIREDKRLTQLYVSKVVGVTTDTVSRWENNRYPSMRRENALKLADALEVPVDNLLRKPPVAPLPAPAPPASRLRWYLGLSLAVTTLSILLIVVLVQSQRQLPPPASITAQRVLPEYAAPGTAIPVSIKLTQRAEEGGFILREYLPKGWKLLQSSPPASSLDNDSGMVRWIVKAGDSRERIVYLVQVDRSSRVRDDGVFQGEIVAGSVDNRAAVPVQGDGRIRVARVHWADLNGDGRIDDAEMLQASHTVDEMGGVQIDWADLERLWNAGGYRWDDGKARFLPARPQ